MKITLFLTLVVLLTLSCATKGQKASSPKSDTILRILVYRLPNFERQNAEGVIAKKYGFMFYGVAGCDVSSELEDSVERENTPSMPYWKRNTVKTFGSGFGLR